MNGRQVAEEYEDEVTEGMREFKDFQENEILEDGEEMQGDMKKMINCGLNNLITQKKEDMLEDMRMINGIEMFIPGLQDWISLNLMRIIQLAGFIRWSSSLITIRLQHAKDSKWLHFTWREKR